MLSKMGYKPGQGIGAGGAGRVAPVEVELKTARTGLGIDEAKKRRTLAVKEQQADRGRRSSACCRMPGCCTFAEQGLHRLHYNQADGCCRCKEGEAAGGGAFLVPAVPGGDVLDAAGRESRAQGSQGPAEHTGHSEVTFSSVSWSWSPDHLFAKPSNSVSSG